MKNLTNLQLVRIAKIVGVLAVCLIPLLFIFRDSDALFVAVALTNILAGIFVFYVMNNYTTIEEKKQYNKRLSFALIALVVFAVILWIVKYR